MCIIIQLKSIDLMFLFYFKTGFNHKVALGSHEPGHLKWGLMSLFDMWLIGLHQLLNE